LDVERTNRVKGGLSGAGGGAFLHVYRRRRLPLATLGYSTDTHFIVYQSLSDNPDQDPDRVAGNRSLPLANGGLGTV
jgi:hypothetical protein